MHVRVLAHGPSLLGLGIISVSPSHGSAGTVLNITGLGCDVLGPAVMWKVAAGPDIAHMKIVGNVTAHNAHIVGWFGQDAPWPGEEGALQVMVGASDCLLSSHQLPPEMAPPDEDPEQSLSIGSTSPQTYKASHRETGACVTTCCVPML